MFIHCALFHMFVHISLLYLLYYNGGRGSEVFLIFNDRDNGFTVNMYTFVSLISA